MTTFNQKKNTKVPCSMKIAPFMVLSLINCTDLSVQKEDLKQNMVLLFHTGGCLVTSGSVKFNRVLFSIRSRQETLYK